MHNTEPFYPVAASSFCSTWTALARLVRWVLQAVLAQDAPVFELGVGAFAGPAQACVGAVGVFLGLRLVVACVGGDQVLAGVVVAVVSRVAHGDQSASFSAVRICQIRAAVMSCAARQRVGCPTGSCRPGGDHLQVHPVPSVLTGVEEPVRGDPVDRDHWYEPTGELTPRDVATEFWRIFRNGIAARAESCRDTVTQVT